MFDGFRSRAKLESFTAIPNELFDKVMKELKGNELKLLLSIFRKTYGWVQEINDKGEVVYKTKDEISLSQFRELTGLSTNTIKKYLKLLQDKGYIIKVYEYDREKNRAACYKVRNKGEDNSYPQPVSNSDRGGVSNFDTGGVSNSDTGQGQNLIEQKKDLKKDNKKDDRANLSTEIKKLFKSIFERKMTDYEIQRLSNYKEELIKKALERTGEYSGKSLAYIIKILEEYRKENITTVEEAEKLHKKDNSHDNEMEKLYQQGYR